MAKITVTLNGVVHYKDLTSTTPITDKIVLSTDKQEANVFFAVGEKVKTTCKYRLSISDFSMQKKMYEPTEIPRLKATAATTRRSAEGSWKSCSST